jgi:DNA-binding NarL/FixJ family response regulator
MFSLVTSLREDSRILCEQLRGTLTQMREVRGQLRVHLARRKNLAGSTRTNNHCQGYGLTRREQEVAGLLAEGQSNAAIARRLGISAHTARHHTQRVLSKLTVHSRAEAGAKLRHR